MKQKLQTLIQKYRAIEQIGTAVKAPHEVICTFKECTEIRIMGDQITFGEDYVSISYARFALQWLVNELGGTVKWDS